MNKTRVTLITLILVAVTLVGTSPLLAQKARVSPHETISAVINGNRVTLVYGRPYSKDPKKGEVRKIWGGLVPWGKAWRTGADEATLLITQQPIVMGETTIPAGAYTLYTVPMESGASKLAVSKKLGQWGIPVDESQDLARIDMKKETLDKPVDQFTMTIQADKSGGGVLRMMWENTLFSVPFTVKK
jgi:hypothetical protein